MTRRFAVLAAVLGLGLSPLTMAAGRQSMTVELASDTSLAGTRIPAGTYKITWTASGAEADLQVTQGKKVVASTKAKVVERDRNSTNDEVVSRKDASGAFSMAEVHVRGEKSVLVVGAS